MDPTTMHANCNKDNGKLSKDHRKQDDYKHHASTPSKPNNPAKNRGLCRVKGEGWRGWRGKHTLKCHLTNWSSDLAKKGNV